jgi:hypothetical protein
VAAAERNLIIVHSPTRQSVSDFVEIRKRIAAKAPDIEVFILQNGQRWSVGWEAAAVRPTLIFSPVSIEGVRPVRGKVYEGRKMSKMAEVRRLAMAGIPVPESHFVTPNLRLDPEAWGPFTVLKPNGGYQGRGIRVVRTRDVRWVDPLSWPRDDPRHGLPLIAQKFIDTGIRPESRRVMLVFGRPVYSIYSRSVAPREAMLDADSSDPIDAPIASNSGDRTMTVTSDEAVLAFARRMGAAFAELPVLGVDIVCEEKTGDLYGLEVNAGGGVWHLSSDHGLKLRAQYGFDLYPQFGALDVIAEALIEVTRREAV